VTTVTATALGSLAFGGAMFGGTAFGSAHHHHGNARLATKLSIKVARRTATNGAADTVFGHLGSRGHRVVRQTIVLQDRAAGSHAAWTNEADAKTGRHGTVHFGVTPSAKTAYRLRYAGNPNFRGSTSKIRVIGVRDTALTINATSTSLDPGASTTISGVLSANGAPASGQTVDLRAKPVGSTARHFTQVASETTGTDGSVSFTQTPAGSTRYLLVFPKTATLQYARSRVVTVGVKASSSLSIRQRVTAKADVVSGNLRGRGHALRHRKVTLLERAAGSSAAFTTVATHRTSKHGLVSFREHPTSSTDYELAYSGGKYYVGCHSGVVTDTVS
jgi:5-hydroxyisourate hydrolase-like protein (transthyretin family)